MQKSRSRLQNVFTTECIRPTVWKCGLITVIKPTVMKNKRKAMRLSIYQAGRGGKWKTVHLSLLNNRGSAVSLSPGKAGSQSQNRMGEILEKLTVYSGKRPTVTFAHKGIASLGIRVGALCGAKVMKTR